MPALPDVQTRRTHRELGFRTIMQSGNPIRGQRSGQCSMNPVQLSVNVAKSRDGLLLT